MAYKPYEPINFENGTLVSKGYVDLETGEFTEPVYSGKAPVNATNLNHLEQGLANLENLVLTSGTASGGGNEPVGTIKMWPTENAPNGYLLANGQAVSRTEYSDLFLVYGTTYGAGDGSTTFNVPDYRDRVPVGLNVNTEYFNALGKKGGEAKHTLTVEELPSHTHTSENEQFSTGLTPLNRISTIGTEGGAKSNSTGSTGGNQSHNNLQPYIVTNYIIKATKVTPTQAEVEDSLESNSTTNAPSIHVVNQMFLEESSDNIALITATSSNVTVNSITYIKYGRMVNLKLSFNVTNNMGNGETIAIIDVPAPVIELTQTVRGASGGKIGSIGTSIENNKLKILVGGALEKDDWYGLTLSYICR